MKKFIVLVTMLMMLIFNGVVSASNGTLLDMEEQFVTLFLDRGNYNDFAMLLSDDIKPDFDEQIYKGFMKDVQSKCGKMKYRKLRIYEKMDDADVLQYEVMFSKAKEMYMYEFAFNVANSKPMLINFQLITLVQEGTQQGNSKKNVVQSNTANKVQQQIVEQKTMTDEVVQDNKNSNKDKVENKKKEVKQKVVKDKAEDKKNAEIKKAAEKAEKEKKEAVKKAEKEQEKAKKEAVKQDKKEKDNKKK